MKKVKNLIIVSILTLGILASINMGGGSSSLVYLEKDNFNHEIIIKNSIPENSATGKPILFDGMHGPLVNPGYQDTEWFFEDYSDVIDYKATGVIDNYLLSQYSGLILGLPSINYTTDELDAITQFIISGGKVYFMGEQGGMLDDDAGEQFLTEFGFSYGNKIQDSDDYDLNPYFIHYNLTNIDNSELMTGVGEYLATSGAYFNDVPKGTRFLIRSDDDGTSTNDIAAPTDYAPVITQTRIGLGEICITLDLALLSNNTVLLNEGNVVLKDYADHPIIVSNIMSWLQTRKLGKTCLVDYTHTSAYLNEMGFDSNLTDSVFEELWEFCDFNTQSELNLALLSNYNALFLPNCHDNFTAVEQTVIFEYIESGGKVFVIGDNKIATGHGIMNLEN